MVKKNFMILSCLVSLISVSLFATIHENAVAAYDTSRIFHAMAKARAGDSIVIGVLGGSITEGYAASTESKRWANLVTDWWKTTFPQSSVTLVNAGLGGTGSDIGTYRVGPQLLKYKPDFVVVEFSVNDAEGPLATQMMEGVIRQLLADTNYPGVMMLLLKQLNGTSAEASHKPVGLHYNVPMVSFADLIDAQVDSDGVALSDLYLSDGIHPVDLGMQYIASFINNELENIYKVLPDDAHLPAIDTVLPAPLVGDVYSHTYMYDANTIVPVSNSGWTINNSTWECSTPGSEIDFQVDGNAISILFSRYFTTNRGMAEAWIDSGTHVKFDGWFNENWGPATVYGPVQEGLADGVHTLHIKLLDEHNAGSNGNYFQILNVLKAGNIGSAAPIAKQKISKKKILINSADSLDGSASFDPDGNPIYSYHWGVYSQPAGSHVIFDDTNAVVTSFSVDAAGYYTLGLVVNDETLNSVPALETIHAVAINHVPVADAGPDRTVSTLQVITLNGMGSSDADNDSLQYTWTLISKPSGRNPLVKYTNTPAPQMKLYEQGDYVFTLVVDDSIAESEPDTIMLTAIDGYSSLHQNSSEVNFTVYPNPVQNSLSINYMPEQPGKLKISIVSMNGKKVVSLFDSEISEKTFKQDFDIKKYQLKGAYILIISTETSMISKKIFIE